jgi:tetratricopeptide (TPR) repeat protein
MHGMLNAARIVVAIAVLLAVAAAFRLLVRPPADEELRAAAYQAKLAAREGSSGDPERRRTALAAAEAQFRAALERAEQRDAVDEIEASLLELGQVYEALDRPRDAEEVYQRLLVTRRDRGNDAGKADALDRLARVYQNEERYDTAGPVYWQALRVREQTLGKDHLAIAANLDNLIELYRAQGKTAETEPMYQRALAIRERALGAAAPETRKTRTAYAALLRDLGRTAEADALLRSLE